MRCVVFTGAGSNEVVRLEERPDPIPGPEDVLVEARFAGLNPADLVQRAGRYSAPPGSPPDVPGLELAGTVAACGERVAAWRPGDRVTAVNGKEVRDTIAAEHITATPDAREQGANLDPGQVIDTGAEAKEFAKIIRAHVLEITGGRTYSEMGRFLTPSGDETNDEAEAATDAQGNPVPNTTRDLWVTATSLTTALNTSFLAERIALFSIVVGVALVLTGGGFLVLTIGVLRPETTPPHQSVLTQA